MSEPAFDVDAAQEQYDNLRGDEPKFEPDDKKSETLDDDKKPDKELPPNFKTYEEFVADGGDPRSYKGELAYEAEHERVTENRRLRKEITGMQKTVKATMDATQQLLSDQRTTMRAEIEAELLKAKEDEDFGAYETATDKLSKLDTVEAQQPPPEEYVEHGVIQDFRVANPLIDKDSNEFNEEFNADVEGFYNETFNRLTQNGKNKLSDTRMTNILNKAMKEARELHSDLFESPNNKRTTSTNRSTRRVRDTDAAPRAENFVIADPTNKKQANAAVDVRDRIYKAAVDQVRKNGGDDKAQQTAGKKAATRFEKSLMS